MTDNDLITRYNYDAFVPENFEPWMRFAESPDLGTPAPNFPLWHLDGRATDLQTIWQEHLYTIVEFGSFT